MEGKIAQVLSSIDWREVVDTVAITLEDHPEIIIAAGAIVFIMTLCLWTILERLSEKGIIALVPVYRFAVLFAKLDIKPILSFLMLVPGANIILRIVFYVKLAQKFNRNYFFVPLLCILPLPFLPIVAFGNGQYQRIERLSRHKEKRLVTSQPNEPVRKTLPNPRPVINKKRSAPRPVIAPVISEQPERISRNQSLPQKKRPRASTPVRNQKTLMPKMHQGPQSRNISIQEKKAALVKETEYERLLKKQKVAARSNLKRKTSPTPNGKFMDLVASPKKKKHVRRDN